jgi:ribosome-associated protein
MPERMPSFSERPAMPEVPESEIEIDYARSSGPGGQNVNKRSTKAVISWNIRASAAFTEEQMAVIEAELANRINKEGAIVIQADATRSREQNRVAAIETLQRIVRKALTPQKERKPTKPSKAAKRRRLDEKKMQSIKKQRRVRKDWE